MTSTLCLSNLFAWWVQTTVLAGLAVVWMRRLEVRSPQIVLGYLQVVLGGCLLLPFLEPWRITLVTHVVSSRTAPIALGPLPTQQHLEFSGAVGWLLVGIAVIRLLRLAVGWWKLRGLRRAAKEFDAEGLCRAAIRADVKISNAIQVPVTFGFRRPIVLLPAQWLDLDSMSRDAIVRHELLHVRRRDWPVHCAEEIMRCVFWFHPALGLLIAEIRLAREQVVDREVARVVGGGKFYARVLLAFTGAHSGVQAPAFMHKRHLARRLRWILEEARMSKSRVLVSFTILTMCLTMAGAVVAWSFPLEAVQSNLVINGGPEKGIAAGVTGGVPGGVEGGVAGGIEGGIPGAQSVAAGSQNPKVYKPGKDVSTPRVLQKVDPAYTKEARDAKIEGTIVLQTEIHPDGRAHNTKVIRSLDLGLDQNALEAISQWQFEPGKKRGEPVVVSATIEVNFRLE